MSLTGALWAELATTRTLYALVALLVVAAFARVLPEHRRPRVRTAAILIAGHLLLTVAVAGEIAAGYDPRWTRVAALACELLGVVALGTGVLFRWLLPRVGVELPRILVDILTAIAVMVALIVVGQRAGFSVAGLITTSAVLTAVVGFALQDTLGNIMGGLALQLDNSVRVGDWISLGAGQPTGRVTEIRWRYTALETRAWETLIVPNSLLMKGQVLIAGRREGQPLQWRRHLDFFVDFRTAPGHVLEVVGDALVDDPVAHTARTPEPHALLLGARDSFAHYQARYWLTDLSADDVVDSAVRVRVAAALRRAGIPMAIPAQTLFVTADDDARAARKAADDRVRRRAAIASVDLFAALPDDAQAALADELRAAPFAAGEAVTREGSLDDGLYVIVDGTAVVQVGDAAGPRQVARLGPGQFFGEMSLMTGEARSATVVAEGELRCYRIDKPALERAFGARPELAERIAEVLAGRRLELAAARGDADGQRGHRLATEKQDLLGRITRFFGLPR